jgi:hypothetical protein
MLEHGAKGFTMMSTTESHLHCADHPTWREEPDYSPAVTRQLMMAYATIQQVPDRVASFREAGYQVITLRERAMCQQQRMNVCYLLGMAHAADDEYSQAVPWLDWAVELARALGDPAAHADLLYLRGLVAQRLNRYQNALDDYRTALLLHRTLRHAHAVVDREQELLLLLAAAGFALIQEEYSLTSRLLAAARRLAREVVAAPNIVAYHDWIWAGYLDACGHPDRALQPALRAAATAAQAGGEGYAAVRINAFAAGLATDLAARHEAQSVGRVTQLQMASACLRTARRALAPNDRVGRGTIAMQQAYLDALRHRTARALGRIGAIEQLARELDDGLLLVQALTVHGHILAEQGEDCKEALRLYRTAHEVAAERGMPRVGLPAWRALRRLEEQLPREDV